MWRVPQREKRYYGGQIFIDDKLDKWINQHSFSSRDFIIGEIRFGEWKKDLVAGKNCYYTKTKVLEGGTKYVNVKIWFKLLDTYVHVYHVHSW